jgi:hypothetical protein
LGLPSGALVEHGDLVPLVVVVLGFGLEVSRQRRVDSGKFFETPPMAGSVQEAPASKAKKKNHRPSPPPQLP